MPAWADGGQQVGIEIPLGRTGRLTGHAVCKGTSMQGPDAFEDGTSASDPAREAERDLADVPAVEVVTTLAVHLMTAAAIRCGLSDSPTADEEIDLAEARILITALAGLVTASAPDLGSQHAAPLRDGLSALQRAFREASTIPDAPGHGPGESLTGPV